MSNSDDPSRMIWVGDLDRYVNLDQIQYWNDQEAKEDAFRRQLDDIGDVHILASKTTSARKLNSQGISPIEWRHAIHLATTSLDKDFTTFGQAIPPPPAHTYERPFIRAMLDLGRIYAIARYARWENLDYSSAITATLPHGIRALVNQYLAAERIERTSFIDRLIRDALSIDEAEGPVAYRRTRRLQAVLHDIANMTLGPDGGRALDKTRTRKILSLTRLYFSICELRLTTMKELRSMLMNYADERVAARTNESTNKTEGRTIASWRLRHVRPLTDFYPFAIRHGLARAASHRGHFAYDQLVNELALAHCSIHLMRLKGRGGSRKR